MKKIFLSLLFLISAFASFGQSGSQALSGVFLRVNDTTTYQAAAATRHSQGYHDIYFNNQATTPHFDIWNGSSYDHVFDFNSGGGAGLVDGDYGDITVGGTGTTMAIDNLAVTNAKINDVAASKVTGGAAIGVTDDANYDLSVTGSGDPLLEAANITIAHAGVFDVSRGGTGTGTQFTPGSILFAGTGGVYDQDNSFWFYDKNNHRVGIGVNSSLASLLNFAAETTAAGSNPIQFALGTRVTTLVANQFHYTTRPAFTDANLNNPTYNGAIANASTDATNTGTGETDLNSTTLKASSLSVNNDKIFATYAGNFAADATATAQLRIYFGTSGSPTLIGDTGALSLIGSVTSWEAEVKVWRVSASVVRCSVKIFTYGLATTIYNNTTEVTGLTLANAQQIKITGTAGGATGGSGDITSRAFNVDLKYASDN